MGISVYPRIKDNGVAEIKNSAHVRNRERNIANLSFGDCLQLNYEHTTRKHYGGTRIFSDSWGER